MSAYSATAISLLRVDEAKGHSKQERYEDTHLPLAHINVLPQPRKTFEGIEELATDIADKGVLKAPIVACFDVRACEEHLRVVNELYGTGFTRKKLMSVLIDGVKSYFILLAGERRLRAVRWLVERGCNTCLEKFGQEKTGACFQRHFNDGTLLVKACRNINALRAMFVQLSENTHMPVPPHEEARAYADLFRLIRKADESYTVAEFARKVGRSVNMLSRALKYVTLHPCILERVEQGNLSYSLALEVARLAEGLRAEGQPFDDERLAIEADLVMAHGYTLAVYQTKVSHRLQEVRYGQRSLFEVMKGEQEKAALRAEIKRVAAKKDLLFLQSSLRYLRRVKRDLSIHEDGKSKYSEKSPRGRVLEISTTLLALIRRYEDTENALSVNDREQLLQQCLQLVGVLEESFTFLAHGFSKEKAAEVTQTIRLAKILLGIPMKKPLPEELLPS